jgi:hypothetical protein
MAVEMDSSNGSHPESGDIVVEIFPRASSRNSLPVTSTEQDGDLSTTVRNNPALSVFLLSSRLFLAPQP